ncbi:hypothetical protein GGS20DRAFT_257172 [Poronia punctata]|nr:hypothetical protein GGS20DRAFT_257172 [Poronia punctata]
MVETWPRVRDVSVQYHPSRFLGLHIRASYISVVKVLTKQTPLSDAELKVFETTYFYPHPARSSPVLPPTYLGPGLGASFQHTWGPTLYPRNRYTILLLPILTVLSIIPFYSLQCSAGQSAPMHTKTPIDTHASQGTVLLLLIVPIPLSFVFIILFLFFAPLFYNYPPEVSFIHRPYFLILPPNPLTPKTFKTASPPLQDHIRSATLHTATRHTASGMQNLTCRQHSFFFPCIVSPRQKKIWKF